MKRNGVIPKTIILLLIISFAASFIGTLAGSGGLIGIPSLLLI
ncbi:hypothetical protein [Peribacillus butanolivorans]